MTPLATFSKKGEFVSNGVSAVDDWRVDVLRLTAFPAPGPPTANAEASWLALFGAPHERSSQDLKNGVTRLMGTVNDAFMVAVENPISFEIQRLASDPGQPPPSPDTLPDSLGVVSAFRDLALRWLGLENCPPLRRLAFGAILLKPVSDQQKGYETLDKHLPDVTVDPSSSDFLYQINRRRPSTAVGGLPLNRLSKWSIQQVQELMISPGDGLTRRSETFACRLELDINSVPSKKPLPKDRLPALFEELVGLANEMARPTSREVA